MKITTVINRVRTLLQDGDRTRWSDPTLLDCFNEAQLAVVQNRPDAHSEIVTHLCNGSARQNLPDEAYRLLDVIDNQLTGRAILRTPREELDARVSNWIISGGTEVELFAYDEKSPGYFFVYPVPSATHVINILIAKTPDIAVITDFATDTRTMEIDTIWLNPVINYMLYRAYMTDGDTRQNQEQALGYLKMFANDLQLKWNVDLIFSQPWPEPNHA